MRAGFPRVQRKEKDGGGQSRARAGRDTRDEAGTGGRVRIGGGLKGSERLDKSNPLKVRPTLCLPMRLRISRLASPRARFAERSVPRSRKEKSHRETRSERERAIKQMANQT